MSLTQTARLLRHLRQLLLVALAVPFSLHAATETGPSSQFDNGWNAYEAGEYREAVAIWTALAEQGHVGAQTNLGVLYDYGTGVTQDYRVAARWYRSAALQNSAVAQYNLSLLIAEGRATPLAGRSARHWMELAADQGYVDAQRALGRQTGHDGSAPEAHKAKLPNSAASNALDSEQASSVLAEITVSTGTAWPVSAGFAVTSHHIVAGRQQITLISNAGRELRAEVIAEDIANDVALLQVSNPDFLPPALPLSPDEASLGASVFTIGFPHIDVMGKSPKLSSGIVSAVNGLRDDPRSYQISVPIQQGNSGGPLLNMRGEVVGMITTMLGETDLNGGPPRLLPNIGYALKTDVIRQLMGKVRRQPIDMDELHPTAGNLEDLASRVKDSVLTVMAE